MSRPTPPEDAWEQESLLADVERLLARTTDWARSAPRWPPFQQAAALIERFRPRLNDLHLTLDRILVVGFLGGSGTGKSTLINALVGQRVTKPGLSRPTTRWPVVVAHTDVDPSFLRLDGVKHEVVRLTLPVLEQMILVDCPDPDTPEPGETSGERNLEALRIVLPRCDVLVHTATAEKYKTDAVARELVKHAPGRVTVFVQTRAAVDPDIREDWAEFLGSIGFKIDQPHIFRLDGGQASASYERSEEPAASFLAFRDYLGDTLARRTRHRIKRANLLGLFEWILQAAAKECQRGRHGVERLEQAITHAHADLFKEIRGRLAIQLEANGQIWRSRLLKQLTCAWTWGPFSGFLRALEGATNLARAVVLTRARTPVQLLMAGGLVVGQAVNARRREKRASENWISGADLGISESALTQKRNTLEGYLHDAGLDSIVSSETRDEPSAEELVEVARRLYQQVDVSISRQIEDRVAQRAGRRVHLAAEVGFSVLPAYLLIQMGLNFFYYHPFRGHSLFGFDYLLQAVFWVAAWGMLLRGVLIGVLNRGLEQDAGRLVEAVSAANVLGPLYADMAGACRAVRRHIDDLDTLEDELGRLREHLGRVDDVGLSAWIGTVRAPFAASEHQGGAVLDGRIFEV